MAVPALKNMVRLSAFVAILIGLYIANRSEASAISRLVKRQSGPRCGGPYQFTVSATASQGTTLGTVTSSSSGGATVWYIIPDATYSQYFNVNPYTGALVTGPGFLGGSGPAVLTFNIQSTDASGVTCNSVVTVTVTGGSGNNGNGNSGANSGTGCPSGYYAFNGVCYQLGLGSNNNNNNGFSSASGTGSSYTFQTSTCTAGSSVGTVSATNGGASAYSINNGNFAISSNGLITLNADLTAGSYSVAVTAYSYYGGTAVTTVTIAVNCNGISGSSGLCYLTVCFNQSSTTTATSVVPAFGATSYSFYTTACTSGAAVGTVTATRASSYNINWGSDKFAISSAGVITLATAVAAGVYSVTAVANNSGGYSQAIPVTVTVTCATG